MDELKTLSQPAASRIPDAVIFPAGWRCPVTPPGLHPTDHVLNAIEPVLGGGLAAGLPGWIREVGGNRRMVTLDPAATLLYPSGHPLEKHPRYDWANQPNGLQYGYLKDPK